MEPSNDILYALLYARGKSMKYTYENTPLY